MIIDENVIIVKYVDGSGEKLRIKGQDEVDLQDWQVITIMIEQEYLKVKI